MDYRIISISDNPKYANRAIDYFANTWGIWREIYKNSIENSIGITSKLPSFYLLLDGEKIIGSYGIITNDFVSRMDIWPYLCALYIEPEYRGNGLGSKLIWHCIEETGLMGYDNLYLCTDHIGLYEKFGFKYLGDGYHPWNEVSRIYGRKLID